MSKPSETLLISAVQADLKWKDTRANLDMFEEIISGYKDRMEVVLLPEMFSTGFVMEPEPVAETMEGPTVTWMKRISSSKKIILAGSIVIRDGDNFHNRLIWMLPNGQYGVYDKRHLFGYAGEDERYSAGNKRLIASAKGWKLNLQVCYDLRFPVWARQSVAVEMLPDGAFTKRTERENVPEYDVLVYVANWPERRSHAWKSLLVARAIENQCYVAGVNRVGTDGNDLLYAGDSMFVDPMGEIMQTVTGEAAVFTYELSYAKLVNIREKLPFLKDADPFIIANSLP